MKPEYRCAVQLELTGKPIGNAVVTVLTKAQGDDPVYRLVWLSEKAWKLLTGLPEYVGSESRIFDLRNRRRHWEHARRNIGREDVNWHDLRAMTATWARQHARQKDLSLIGRALGHSGTQVTERYARVVDREIVEMLDQLPDVTPDAGAKTKTAINDVNQKAL